MLGFSAADTAHILAMTTASVHSALQLARTALDRQPDRTAHEPSTNHGELVSKYMRAWQTKDVPALVALLRSDAQMAMPPTPSWYQGRDSIGIYLRHRRDTDRSHGDDHIGFSRLATRLWIFGFCSLISMPASFIALAATGLIRSTRGRSGGADLLGTASQMRVPEDNTPDPRARFGWWRRIQCGDKVSAALTHDLTRQPHVEDHRIGGPCTRVPCDELGGRVRDGALASVVAAAPDTRSCEFDENASALAGSVWPGHRE